MGMVFVGHDWAEAHHDVHVEDDQLDSARTLLKFFGSHRHAAQRLRGSREGQGPF